jgi:1-deoxy-D-xylulose-5-phosphate synthase
MIMDISLNCNSSPFLFRYPRGSGCEDFNNLDKIQIGKGKYLSKITKNYKNKKIAIISIGDVTKEAFKAYNILKDEDIEITLFDAIFLNPIDRDEIINISKRHDIIITLECESFGGLGSAINEIVKNKVTVKNLHLPHKFIEHSTAEKIKQKYDLDYNGIVKIIRQTIQN